jgi:hypothetical protein
MPGVALAAENPVLRMWSHRRFRHRRRWRRSSLSLRGDDDVAPATPRFVARSVAPAIPIPGGTVDRTTARPSAGTHRASRTSPRTLSTPPAQHRGKTGRFGTCRAVAELTAGRRCGRRPATAANTSCRKLPLAGMSPLTAACSSPKECCPFAAQAAEPDQATGNADSQAL